MPPGRPSSLALLALVAVAGLAAPACSVPRRTASFDITQPVTRVEVDVDRGTTTVVATDAPAVSVRRTVHHRRGRPKLAMGVVNGALTLRSRCPSGFLVSCAVDHRVAVPPHTEVMVRAGSGDVAVERMQAGVDVGTASGRVHLVRAGGLVTARTGSGEVVLDGASDQVTVETASGHVTGQHLLAPEVKVSAGSGKVELRFEREPDSVEVTTGSGAVSATVPKGAYQVETNTGSGNVSVKGLEKKNTARHIRATTVSGDITVSGS